MKIDDLLLNIDGTDHPQLQRSYITRYINYQLGHDGISLYEGYLLNQECIRLSYKALTEPAWNEKSRVYSLVAFVNQKLLTELFNDSTELIIQQSNLIRNMIVNPPNHYILDLYEELMEVKATHKSLYELIKARGLKNLPDYYYPSHCTAFPGDCNFESLLLNNIAVDREVKEEIIDLIVKLAEL